MAGRQQPDSVRGGRRLIHLATAVAIGADRFITNNKRDFPAAMTEIAVTYPADLPDGTS